MLVYVPIFGHTFYLKSFYLGARVLHNLLVWSTIELSSNSLEVYSMGSTVNAIGCIRYVCILRSRCREKIADYSLAQCQYSAWH